VCLCVCRAEFWMTKDNKQINENLINARKIIFCFHFRTAGRASSLLFNGISIFFFHFLLLVVFFGNAFLFVFLFACFLFFILFHFIDQHFKCCLHSASCFHSTPTREYCLYCEIKAFQCNKFIFVKYNVSSLGMNCLNAIFIWSLSVDVLVLIGR
jgi:hypothetical protein